MKILSRIVLLSGIALLAAIAKTPEKIENFSLNDYNGEKVSFSDYHDSKAVVLMFIATQCPVSNAYNERYDSLYGDYTSKGIAFVAINSNKQESVEEIKEHAKEHGFKFPVLKDVNNVIADKLGAEHTPEIFVVIPSTMEIVYHGRIDDSRREDKITSRDLRNALDEILAGKTVAVKETKAFGCSIKRIN